MIRSLLRRTLLPFCRRAVPPFRRRVPVAAAALLFAGAATTACAHRPDESPMPGMTAEEHAKMEAGGTQGGMDSTGAPERQMVHLTAQQEKALGVVYTTVTRETLTRTIRTVGQIAAPEPRIADVSPKIDGFAEHLFVSFTGDAVRKGQPLLAIYSPTLVAAEQELLTARRLVGQVDSTAGEADADARATHDAQVMPAMGRRRPSPGASGAAVAAEAAIDADMV